MGITESRVRRMVREEARRLMVEAPEGLEQRLLDEALHNVNYLFQVGLADLFEQAQPPHESYLDGTKLIAQALKQVEHRLLYELSELYLKHKELKGDQDKPLFGPIRP